MRKRIYFWLYEKIYYWNHNWWKRIYYKIPSFFQIDMKYLLKFDLRGYRKWKECESRISAEIEKGLKHNSNLEYGDYSVNITKLTETA